MLRSLRHGFATNSSSTHSILFHARREIRIADTLGPTGLEGADDDCFVLASARDKALYILGDPELPHLSAHERLQLCQCLAAHDLSDLLNDPALDNLAMETQTAEVYRAAASGGVDFLTWFDFILQDEVMIHGYHDMDSQTSLLIAREVLVPLHDRLRWRRDGKALIAYSPLRGTRMRFSRTPYEKASVPELVDLKITDRCIHGCAFCYQGSTRTGAHAPLARIRGLLETFAELGVFEVALGGGEPVDHPDFPDILRIGRDLGLTMNFTTYATEWSRDSRIVSALKSAPGCGIGVSVHGKRDLKKIGEISEALRNNRYWADITAQTVVGAASPATLAALMQAAIDANMPLLLLGYKATGRGADFTERRPDETTMRALLEKVRAAVEANEPENENCGFCLGVDTAFLERYGSLLDEMEVPHVLRTSPEGKFSMYVDAVAGACGPSSYCDPSAMEPLGDIRTQFARW